jgi:hypothetical protein
VETEPGPQSRLKIVETVVRARVTNPDAQARILTAARERLANWLDRGAHFDDLDVGRHRAGHRERRR